MLCREEPWACETHLSHNAPFQPILPHEGQAITCQKLKNLFTFYPWISRRRHVRQNPRSMARYSARWYGCCRTSGVIEELPLNLGALGRASDGFQVPRRRPALRLIPGREYWQGRSTSTGRECVEVLSVLTAVAVAGWFVSV